MNQKWVSFRVISLVNCDSWTMSFPCSDTELYLAQNTFSEQGFRWMACQEELLLFILMLAQLLPSAARQERVWAWPCLVLELRGCSCPAAPAWGWGCACAGKRKVLGLLEALQAANCDQSCVALMPTKQETQPESRIPDRQEIGSYCGCLKFFFSPLICLFYLLLLLPYIFGVWSCLFQLCCIHAYSR